jgi:hypothetical protein
VLITILVIIFIARLQLLGKGSLEDTDEWSFLHLLMHFDDLLSLNIKSWLNMAFHANSPLFESFFRFFQVFFLKIYANIIGVSTTSSEALVIISVFNVITTIFISFILYKILIRFGFNRIVSIIGIIIFSTLFNSNLYIRHILAYDTALLFNLLGLYVAIKPNINKLNIFLSGVFCSIGYFSYAGYFTFFMSVLFIICLI